MEFRIYFQLNWTIPILFSIKFQYFNHTFNKPFQFQVKLYYYNQNLNDFCQEALMAFKEKLAEQLAMIEAAQAQTGSS